MSKIPESVVSIDENHLDRECICLPTDYLRAAHQAAGAKRDVAELSAALSVVEAELSKAIRSSPQTFGLEKVTESAISNILICYPKYQTAKKEVVGAQYEADLAQALVWALEHKKRSLTLLVELHGMGYFSS